MPVKKKKAGSKKVAKSTGTVYGGYGRAVAKKYSPLRKTIKEYVKPYTSGYLRNAGAVVGNLASSLTGIPGGAVAGSMLGDYLGNVTGFGKYTINKNSILNKMTGSSVPFVHGARDGVRIRHRESLGDLVVPAAASTFNNQTFNLNPGLDTSFPWLAAVAQNFEEYKFHGVIFEFVSTSANALNSTNTALGTVVMAAEYNTAQSAYVNKQQMENSMWALSSKPSSNICMPIECDMKMNPISQLYVRTGAVPSGKDIRMYDLCNVQVATVGMQGTGPFTIGELWISYDVEFYKPQLSSGLNIAGNSAHYQLNAAAVTTAYFGTTQTQKFDSIGITFPTNNTLQFPLGAQGIYSLDYNVIGTSAACTQITATLTNCSFSNILAGNTISSLGSSGTTTIYLHLIYINITDTTKQASVVFSGGTLPTAATSADIVIEQCNGDLN